jgi:2-polyprenyl-3-methyl-5-hydroxy-6-metoxy-1,4-benzoquinol methylase
LRPPADTAEALRQVGKTVLGTPVGDGHIETIVRTIVDRLDLRSGDRVVDLGCGNGFLTSRVAPHVRRILGMDVSENLIAVACATYSSETCSFAVGDLTALPGPQLHGATKVYAYEVLQHLSFDETVTHLRCLRSHLEPVRYFVGSIPDVRRLRAFYDTDERYAYYQQRCAEGTEQIGHWWHPEELERAAASNNLTCTVHPQATDLYTAHYRFDALLASP